jgi:hypothetical protein
MMSTVGDTRFKTILIRIQKLILREHRLGDLKNG